MNTDLLTPTDHSQTLLTFILDEIMLALPVEPVRQIIEMVTITPIPQVNHSIVGVINFHGSIVPVVDLRKHLGFSVTALHLHTPIILVSIKDKLVGLIVDQVLDVLSWPERKISYPQDVLPEDFGEVPLLKGVMQTNRNTVFLIDLAFLFKPQQVLALQAAAQVDFTSLPESQPQETISKH
jgi:purine-binding chemotaxis protein CheW